MGSEQVASAIHSSMDIADDDDWKEYVLGYSCRGFGSKHMGQCIGLDVLISRLVCNGEVTPGEE